MLVLLAGLMLMQWRRVRQLSLQEPQTSVPYDPRDLPSYLRMRAIWRKVFLVWLGLNTILFASLQGESASGEAAMEVVRQCSERLSGDALQACLLQGHETLMDSAYAEAALSTWNWIVFIL